MESCKITYIYGLYEIGKEDEIRYVGKSDNLNKRLKDHLNDKRKTSHKSCWISSVINKGGKIGILPIQVISIENWKEKEIFWISEMRKKFDLTNLTDGGDGTMKNIYNKTYQECKDYLTTKKPIWVITMTKYKEWTNQSDFPKFLPKAPNRVFNEWISWGDYLGTGSIHTIDRRKYYLSYEDAKKYLKENFNLNGYLDFKGSKMPSIIPTKPDKVYKEWIGWEDFLGYKSNIRKRTHEYMSYENAKKWMKLTFGEMSVSRFRQLVKDNNLPIDIPKKPDRYYKRMNKWINWQDFLSSSNSWNGKLMV